MSPHPSKPFAPSTDEVDAFLADIRYARESGAGYQYVIDRHPGLMEESRRWEASRFAAPMAPPAAYPAPAMVAPYAGSGVAPVQQVLLPDGRVVTGYSMAPAAAPQGQPAVGERRGLDPGAQRLAGAGVFAVGVGVGGSMLLSAAAAAESALVAIAVCLVALWAMRGRGGGRAGSVNVNVRVSNNPQIITSSTSSSGR